MGVRRAQRWMVRATLAGLAAFALIAVDDALRGPLYHADRPINDAVSAWQELGLPAHEVGTGLSQIGNSWIVGAIVGTAALWMWRRNHGILAAWSLGIALATELTIVGLKALFQRSRPSIGDELPLTYSFPSGHTLSATATLGAVIILLTEVHRRTRGPGPHRWTVVTLWKAALSAWAVVAFVAGLGRILAQKHWLTDVLASWSLGFALGAGLLFALSHHHHGGDPGPKAPPRHSA